MKKITLYIIILLALPAMLGAQSISSNINTKPVKICQFRAGIDLIQKSPSQLNPLVTVGFTLTKASEVSLKICDADGKVVVTLLNEELSAGYHSVQYYIPGITIGKYYYSFTAESDGRQTAKRELVLL